MAKKLVKNLTEEILKEECLTDWKVEWSVDLECAKEFKTIFLNHKLKDDCIFYAFEMIIHEITHVLDERNLLSNWKQHDSVFYEKMGDLLKKHSNLIDKYNKKQKEQLSKSREK